jgi:hypothetical protein
MSMLGWALERPEMRGGPWVALLLMLGASGRPASLAAEPARLEADTACHFGASSCNRCVRGALAAVRALGDEPTAAVRYSSMAARRLPPYGATLSAFGANDSHLQGIARLVPNDGSNWVVVSRAQPGQLGGGGFFLVQLGDVPAHGGAPFGSRKARARYVQVNSETRRTRYYHPVESSDHPGGLQMLGQTLALAASCDSAKGCTGRTFVEFHDLSEPSARDTRLQRFFLFRQGEPYATPHATSVAVAKERDGRYLMFVHGKDDRREGWFYRSDADRIGPETQWRYIDHFQGDASWDGKYQSTTLLSECGSGDLYLLGTGNPSYRATLKPRWSPGIVADLLLFLLVDGAVHEGRELLHLFKLEQKGSHIDMRRVYTASWQPDRGAYCSFRAGATAYVTPEGRLALYCTTRKANTNLFGSPDSKLKLLEFADD